MLHETGGMFIQYLTAPKKATQEVNCVKKVYLYKNFYINILKG